MRIALLLVLTIGCGHPAASTLPKPLPVTPAHDLSAAKSNAAPVDPSKSKLEAKDPRVTDLDIIRITAHSNGPGGDAELTSVASADLFKQANASAKDGNDKDAIARYRQLVAEFPDSQFAPVALFNIAAIFDREGDPAQTISTLQELVASYPQARESIDGHLYIAAVQADHKQWPEATATLTAVLARPNLTYADRVEALARQGYVAIEQHAYDKADTSLDAAIGEWRKAPRIEDPYYIAMAHYYRGELMHRRFLEAQVRTGDDEMVADLDAKRALAVQAYDRWRESLGFKQAYWATAAGYQMSQIFVEVWQAHVSAPYPHRIALAARPVYVADVHDKVREDLKKALDGHQKNVELAKAYGVETQWSKGSEQQAAKIMELLARDNPGTFVTPETK